jgi:hypothetical protein
VILEVVEERELRLRGPDFTLTLEGLGPMGETIPIEDESRTLRAQRDSRMRVQGLGFRPGSVASVWMFSSPVLLGQLEVGADGQFSGEVLVPGVIDVGRHTVQVNGVSIDSKDRSLSLGVLVGEVMSGPSMVDFEVGPGSVTVTWMAPPETGPQVTGYFVEYRVIGSEIWTRVQVDDPSVRSWILEGLDPARAYEIRVAAVTEEGLGVWVGVPRLAMPLSTEPSIDVRASVDQLTPALGDTVTVTMTVSNPGAVVVRSIELSVAPSLPRLRVVEYQPTVGSVDLATGVWRIEALDPGVTVILIIKAVVVAGGDAR